MAVDLAKDVYQVVFANRAGRIIERQHTRRQFERLLNEVAVDTEVIVESCGTAHYCGRLAQARELRVRLLPVQYVRYPWGHNRTLQHTENQFPQSGGGGILRLSIE